MSLHYKMFSVLSVFCLVILVPLMAVAQGTETTLPLLNSTGLPSTEFQEEVLPQGAVVHLRINSLQELVENLDSMLMTFLPEQTMPPDFQSFLTYPHPIVAFLTAQAFGQPMPIPSLAAMFGIALDRPISLTMYPLEPQQGFVLSVPMDNPEAFTGSVQNVLMPDAYEEGAFGDITYYHVTSGNYDLPDDFYILASDRIAYLCGSPQLAEMLASAGEMGAITADPAMQKSVESYQHSDVILTASHGFIKPQIPLLKEEAAGALRPLFQQMYFAIEQIPPQERAMLDFRLRLQFGIDGVDQLARYIEAYTSGIYAVLLDEVAQFLIDLEGVALAINVEEQLQHAAFTFYSQDFLPEHATQTLPLDDIKTALSHLPGEKSNIIALGQMPPNTRSQLVDKLLAAVETELRKRELPLDGFLALKTYHEGRQLHLPLEAKVPWSLQSIVKTTEPMNPVEFSGLLEFLQAWARQFVERKILLPVQLLPLTDSSVVEEHFAAEAAICNQNEHAYREMLTELPVKEPFYDKQSAFFIEDLEEGVKTLTLEYIYTTRHGFFGYQEHELVNRRIAWYRQYETYALMHPPVGPNSAFDTMLSQASHPVPASVTTLLEQVPATANSLTLLKTLPVVLNLLNGLQGVEALIHKELDNFLAHLQDFTAEYEDGKELQTALLDADVAMPPLMVTVNRDVEGNLYCLLPGGLHYPRQPVMPLVQELFKDFAAGVSDVGGSVSFTAVAPGEYEIASVQSTAALSLLMKSVANNFFTQYVAKPGGMEHLLGTLMHPADRQKSGDETVFMNPIWEAVKGILEEAANPEAEKLLRFLIPANLPEQRAETLMQMRAIATGLGSYLVDYNFFPVCPEERNFIQSGLPSEYYSGTYKDVWGNPFTYISDGESYTLRSYGKDGVPGDGMGEFDKDLIYSNGILVYPETAY